MNKKVQRLLEPGTRLYLVILVLFAACTFFVSREVAAVECGVIVLLLMYSLISGRKNRKKLLEYIESVTYDMETAKNNTLLNFPLPMVVFRLDDYQVIWGNSVFFDMCGRSSPAFQVRVTDLVPEFTGKWLMEGKSQHPGLITIGGRKYQIHGNIVRGENKEGARDFMGITYWMDVTEFDDVKLEYQATRPVVAIIAIDNYDELLKNMSDRSRTELRVAVEEKVAQWCAGRGGMFQRYERDRFLYVFEERHLAEMVENKFSLLDSVRGCVSPSGIHATVSIGIGRDGSGYEENFGFAALGIDMALSRGGDQAVIKDRFRFEFFGGRGAEVETRTKVKSRVMANALGELIADASQTFVMGHKYADLDSLGAAVGVCCIARSKGKSAKIVMDLENNACGDLLTKLRREEYYRDAFISAQDAILKADSRSVLVVVDTNRPEQAEDESLLLACNRVAVIDHHRRAATYIQNPALSFLEPYASSVCELMAELLQELVGQSDITRYEAEAMLSGIVMDTKNFTIRTGGRTFDAAAFLHRAGADTTEVKKLLQSDLEFTVARYSILERAKVYRGSIAIAAPETAQDRVVAAQAADELLNIRGVEASIVIYPSADGGAMISARSIGDVNVQVLLEDFGGGGNRSSAGAQLKDINIRDAVNLVFQAVDKYFDS